MFEKITAGFYQKSIGDNYEMFANVIKSGSKWTAEIRNSRDGSLIWRTSHLDTKRTAEQMVTLHNSL